MLGILVVARETLTQPQIAGYSGVDLEEVATVRWFHRKHRQLLDQFTQFPLAKNDDGPDALEMAMQAVKKKEGAWSISDW